MNACLSIGSIIVSQTRYLSYQCRQDLIFLSQFYCRWRDVNLTHSIFVCIKDQRCSATRSLGSNIISKTAILQVFGELQSLPHLQVTNNGLLTVSYIQCKFQLDYALRLQQQWNCQGKPTEEIQTEITINKCRYVHCVTT